MTDPKKPKVFNGGIRFDGDAMEFVVWSQEDDRPLKEIRFGISQAVLMSDWLAAKIDELELRSLL